MDPLHSYIVFDAVNGCVVVVFGVLRTIHVFVAFNFLQYVCVTLVYFVDCFPHCFVFFSFRQFGQFAFRVSQHCRHVFVDFFFQVVDSPDPNEVVAFVVFNADVTEQHCVATKLLYSVDGYV